MGTEYRLTSEMRRTRFVCISDTHGQTPKLPKGDVLIHAGDLSNQGGHTELKKSVDWLEKAAAAFEEVIVVAGNHDLTLDPSFFTGNISRWKWPEPQDPQKCQLLFQGSPFITYLEHESATFYLDSPKGPHTRFKVLGSPYSPGVGDWAFQYEPQEAATLWDAIPSDTDIVVTHTPPKGHCDTATKDGRSGCEVLLQALHRVRPRLSVFGHIHEARGVEIVQWNTDAPENGHLVSGIEVWEDPGRGNKKQSLVSLSTKGVRSTVNASATVPRCSNASSLASGALLLESGGGNKHTKNFPQPGGAESTSRCQGVADTQNEAETIVPAAPHSDIGLCAVRAAERGNTRETIMVNAAYLGPRIGGRSTYFNKPIVVDVDLPVWTR